MLADQITAINNAIKERVKKEVESLFPVIGKNNRIELDSIFIDTDREPDISDYEVLKDLKLRGKTLAAPVKVTVRLLDNSGKLLDKGTHTIMKIPLQNITGSFLINGTDYYVPTQLRLKAGVYHRQKTDNPFEGRFNLEKGLNFRMVYDPSNMRIRITMGSKTIDAINFLLGLGVTEAELKRTLGEDVATRLLQNAKSTPEKELAKFRSILDTLKDEAVSDRSWVTGYLENTEMDPNVNQITLGERKTNVDTSLMLSSIKKLLDLAKGEGTEDHTSSIIFKKAFTTDDLLGEAYEKQMRLIKNTLKNRVDRYSNLREIILPSYFQKPIDQFFVESSLSQAVEAENPTSMVAQSLKTTLTGKGGFEDSQAISELDRSLDPYYLGFLDPVHTPESDKIGVNLFRTLGSKLKPGTKELWSSMVNVRTGRKEDVTPIGIYDKYVAFPNEGIRTREGIKWRNPGAVKVLHRGVVQEVPAEKVDYLILSAAELFDPTTNLIPFLNSNQGSRAMMASKHISHAIGLAEPEAPMVMTEAPNGQPYERTVGEATAVLAPEDGVIVKITDNYIDFRGNSGKKHKLSLAHNFPTSGNYFLDHRLRVKEGEQVKKGEVLADSNFTQKGFLALGKNLNVAYMNYKGYNYEDGIVISESAAKKMASEHLYPVSVELNENIVTDKEKFRAYYPTRYSSKQLEKLDNDGVIKKGQTVSPGDPLILALKKRTRSLNEELLGDLSKQVLRDWKPAEEEWEGITEGTVVDVVKTPRYIKLLIRTTEPMRVGDKMTGRHGNKGTIAAVLPDSEMPHTENGTQVEVLLNPHGITSRINPSQLLEVAAAKIADKLGTPVQVAGFEGRDNAQYIKNLMTKYKIADKEKIIDPKEGAIEEPTLVGKQYFIKLPQQVSKKTSIREEMGYDADYQPLKGSSKAGGARAVDALTLYALISHGARNNMKEMATYKAERNDEFWEAVQSGKVPPPAKPTFAYDKFTGYLRAAGINTEKQGDKILIKPLTDREVEAMSKGEITTASMLSGYNFKPEKGGLFDPDIMGGLEGNNWGHIDLAIPIPNPTFEKEIPTILGITSGDYTKILNGSKGVVKNTGELTDSIEEAVTGPEGIKILLSRLDIDAEIKETEKALKTEGAPDKVDKLLKRLRYLKGLKKNGTKPQDLVITKVPVIPSKFRPVYAVEGDDQMRISDINLLYRDLILANNAAKSLKDKLPEAELQEIYQTVYEALSALSGKGEPISMDSQRTGAEGVLRYMGSSPGQSPKEGYFQGKLVRKRQELSSTGVIQNGPELGMDEAGIPYKMAVNLYKPFITKELKNLGKNPKEIKEMMDAEDPVVINILNSELEKRPILLNRSPSLHKFNIMAFRPKVVAGDAIRINPTIVKGFNADFDGDQMGVHVPVTEDARREAFKMLPSNNLFKPGTNSLIHGLRLEYISGLYQLTKPGVLEGEQINYNDYETLYKDYLDNRIKYTQPVKLDGVVASAGQHLINGILPKKYRNYEQQWGTKSLGSVLKPIAEKDGEQYANIVNHLKEIGRVAAYRIGIGMGVEDLLSAKTLKDKVQPRLTEIKKIKDNNERAKALEELAFEIEKLIKDEAETLAKDKNNAFYKMFVSGAKGSAGQLKQILTAPIAVADTFGETVPVPIEKSYAEGLDPAEYWASLYGARFGMIAKKMMVAEPGALNKEILNSLVEKVISVLDDPEDPGIPMKISDKSILGRVLAEDVYLNPNKIIAKKGDVIDGDIVKSLTIAGIKEVPVKSTLTATVASGIPATSFGLDETGKLPRIGDNIGIKSGQALSEPLSQTSMSLFHSGGAAGESNVAVGNVFEAIQKTLNMPKTLKNAAVLSKEYGKVNRIENRTGGGFLVTIGDKVHEVPGYLKLIVKEGDTVRVGQPLSNGQLPPRELLETRGLTDLQEALVEELKKYLESMGESISRNTLEVIVSGVTQTATVTDDKNNPNFSTGDIVPVQKIFSAGLKNRIEVPLSDPGIHQYRTAKNYGTVRVHTLITPQILKELQAQGLSSIQAYRDPVDWKPVIVGSGRQALSGTDWLHKMTFRYLRQALPESAIQGDESNIHGYNPLSSWVYGAEITKGPKGQY